jgi:Mrp family chromosome partitioning ATPase
VIVSSPQKLVEMIVGKSVKMAKMMDKKVLGLVENMSYFICPDCSKKHEIFGESQAESLAKCFGIDNVVRLPINPDFARTIDAGAAENLVIPDFESFISNITD